MVRKLTRTSKKKTSAKSDKTTAAASKTKKTRAKAPVGTVRGKRAGANQTAPAAATKSAAGRGSRGGAGAGKASGRSSAKTTGRRAAGKPTAAAKSTKTLARNVVRKPTSAAKSAKTPARSAARKPTPAAKSSKTSERSSPRAPRAASKTRSSPRVGTPAKSAGAAASPAKAAKAGRAGQTLPKQPPGSRSPGATKTGARMGTMDLLRERTAGRVKRAVRRVISTVAETAAAAIRPAPRPASALRPEAKPRPRSRSGRAAVPGVVIKGRMGPRYQEILSPGALSFLAELHRRFDEPRRELLAARADRQARFDAGELPDFLPETREIREGDWTIAAIPPDLQDRRVEITGPVDRKMIVNALNSGATHYMADFEDANSPTWSNNLEGQINLRDLWDGKIDFTDETTGKEYAVKAAPAVMIVRPRGWHKLEEHLTVDGKPISGALFDFGLFFFHNAKSQLGKGTGPYFYLPKLESHREARLWNDVFVFAEEKLGVPAGTIKATVLIETLPAAFEMDEILYELRDHIAGLNAGRWDYIFSFIKKLRKRPDYILPDRSQVVMGKAFLGAYALLLIKTCHRRGALAIGGMAAQIPVKGNPEANDEAFAKVRADKEREVRDGHDGTWVAHPDLVPVAREVFDRLMPQSNQLDRLREDVEVTQADLLRVHDGTKTEEGFRQNIRVGVQYIEAWLRGRGAVPIYNLMEDVATAEISRAQVWQWIQYRAVLENGTVATPEFFEQALGEEMERVRREVGEEAYDAGRFPEAIDLFRRLSLAEEFEDFLTLVAYKLIV